MVIKSYSKDNVEIYITANDKNLYNVIRSVKGNESAFVSDLDFEDAEDTFDYFLEMELQNEKI